MAKSKGIEAERKTLGATTSRYCGIGLYAMAALWGAIQIAAPDNGLLYLTAGLLFATFASCWALFDAKSRGVEILPVLQMLYFLLWPVGAVIYLMYRSGMRGLLIAVVHAVGITVTLCVSNYATLYGLHYTSMFDARFYE